MKKNEEKRPMNAAREQEEKMRALFEVEELEDRFEMATWGNDGPDGPLTDPPCDGPDGPGQ